jgi:hypothetical protein
MEGLLGRGGSGSDVLGRRASVRAYLSRQHFEDVDNSCPLVALPTDAARSGTVVKRAFEGVFAAMVGVLERSLPRNGRGGRKTAQAIAALCVGGMVVARGTANRAAADELRDACRDVALALGAWDAKGDRRKKAAAQGVRAVRP